MHKIVVSGEIQAFILKMHPELKKKLKTSLKIILSEPHSGKELMDEVSGLRSFRLGSFRIIYRIENSEQIEQVAIGPRARIYEETFRIIRKNERSRAIRVKPIPLGTSTPLFKNFIAVAAAITQPAATPRDGQGPNDPIASCSEDLWKTRLDFTGITSELSAESAKSG